MREFHNSILPFAYMLLTLFLQTILVPAQDNSISFSPNRPLCNGDVVEMVCILESSVAFSSTIARVSLNSSTPITLSNLNTDVMLSSIDLSRYSASNTGLTLSLNRAGIRVNIRSYQPSDSATTFGCHAVLGDGSISSAIVSAQPNVSAAPPSAPISLQSSVSNFNTATCSADISLSWNTPPSNRTVDRYFLYLDGSPLSTTNSNSYNHSTNLTINTDYQYSVTAMSCAGNSTISSTNVNSVKSYTLLRSFQPVCLVYNNVTGILTVNWRLNATTQPSGVSGLSISYSLQLLYSQIRQGATYTYTDSTSFTLPSSQLSYNTVLTARKSPQLEGGRTNITANLTIVQQCGQSFSGTPIEFFLRIKNLLIPPTSTPNTVPPTTSTLAATTYSTGATLTPTPTPFPTSTPTNDTVPPSKLLVIIGSAVGVVAFLFILITLIIMFALLVIFLRKKKEKKKQTGLDGSDVKKYDELEDTYSKVNKKNKVELTYLEIDHSSGTGKIVRPPTIPPTNYVDIADLPQESLPETTQYVSLQN